ncbi:DUF2933 domain-containing protein [Ruegeria sediminis]|uniref:DUF2933 domain-containing protein n=1 Tax=Ruegeria sediminis TaxID=2583820 RepID=A0ABY2X4X6_9RHOB|nr:DUF2933 domain-containing protein [Ruegeria sediminis]TMV10000.1 DUF2933 domain-containing protein [Ruegeria sediminis]
MSFQAIDGSENKQGSAVSHHPSNSSDRDGERHVHDKKEDPRSTAESPPKGLNRRWLPLAIALVVGAGVLSWEYRDVLFSGAGTSALFLLICLGMHFLMHRGHGGHGGGGNKP